MGGPWENYASPSAEEAGPWSKYAAASAPAAASGPPQVPFYVNGPDGKQINAYDSPEAMAQLDATHQATVDEQAAFDASRTPGKRLGDTAAFAASLPVRMATKGEYGAGDVVGAVSPGTGQAMNRAEGGFARANEKGLRAAADVGDVMAGVPILSSMGAVPGQVLRQGATEFQALREGKTASPIANAFLREEQGSGRIASPQPGGPVPPSAPPPVAPAAAPGIPDRPESFATRDRINSNLGVNVDLPEMIVGSKADQSLAAGMKGMPHVGTPIERANEKFLGQMGEAKQAVVSQLGEPVGAEAVGGAVKQDALDWIRKNSRDYLNEKYEQVYSTLDQEVTRPLSATATIATRLAKEMDQSTGTAAAPAMSMVKAALEREGGLNAKGLAQLRSEIGAKIDAAKVVPDAGEAAYKRLYPALTEDLRATIKQAGGDQALRAWDVANREAKIVAGKRKRLAQVIGSSEDKLSDEAVFKKVQSIATEGTSNLKNLRQIREVVGEKNWLNVGAEIVNRMGVEPKAKLLSPDRFLTAYGKMSVGGKNLVFGEARPHLDDIAALLNKYGEFSSGFNRSNTGKVNFILKFAKLVTNPVAMATTVGSSFANPMAAATIAGHASSVLALRAKAWSLAKPANAAHTARLLRAYDTWIKALDGTAGSLASQEKNLAAAIRTYAQGVGAQTGQNADEVAAAVQKSADDARNPQAEPKKLSHDDIEAAIVKMVKKPGDSFSIPELRKQFPDASEAEFSRALGELSKRGKVELQPSASSKIKVASPKEAQELIKAGKLKPGDHFTDHNGIDRVVH